MLNIHTPLFSVVITTYNRKMDLTRALESICAQTFRNFEVIIVDDGSTDGSEQVVLKYNNQFPLKYIWQENWGGPAKGRNVGVSEAKGTWICYLDADDWWYPQKLEVLTKHIDGHDVIYHELDYHDKNGPMGRKTNGRVLQTSIFQDLMVGGNCLSNSGVSVRKVVIERTGFVSEERELIMVEDYDLWLRISCRTERFLYLENSMGVYWIGENISAPSTKYIARIEYLTKKHLGLLPHELQRQALFRKKYIVARNKQEIGDSTAFNEFLDVAMGARSWNLKFRCLYFACFIGLKKIFYQPKDSASNS